VKCIVGLGNPGSRYRKTRHNIGFLTVESLIEKFNARSADSNELYECYRSTVNGEEVSFLMPQTYMNNSGMAVKDFRSRQETTLDELLIIYDDFQLPFGTLRLRPKGSDGGHNGLASIIYHLESDLIPRLRIGVGGATLPNEHTHESMADYVLSPFDADEEKLLPRLFEHTREACISWKESGMQTTMNRYNRNFFTSAGAE
jgi:PTH1 family peptidyl-tRNA hydrolase